MRGYKLKLKDEKELSVINYRDKVAIGLIEDCNLISEVHLPLCDADKLCFYIEEICNEIRVHNLKKLEEKY
jgi:hypothetical protein